MVGGSISIYQYTRYAKPDLGDASPTTNGILATP